MKTEEITIRVGTEAANAYRSASDEDRRKLDLLLSLKLTDVGRTSGSLKEVMSEISRKAQERGLTPVHSRGSIGRNHRKDSGMP